VIGSEGKGLRKTVSDQCDILVSIPMYGKINSLNVSVATGILAFEILDKEPKKLIKVRKMAIFKIILEILPLNFIIYVVKFQIVMKRG
jgi:tRNA C32,U32 (ribose-2'-O)-methylase TrmJ